MNKQEIIKQFQKEEDKFLIAKVLDKVQFTNTRNQVQNTEFLDGYEQKIVQKVLQQIKFNNVIFYGGYEQSERNMAILFPTKLQNFLEIPAHENRIIQDLISVISINLPLDLKGKYHHRDYLSGLMKIGVKREKIGDILVRESGADILVQKDMAQYFLTNLNELTRFQKSDITQKTILDLKVTQIKKEQIIILVPQLRLDAVVTELIHGSRTKANDFISKERVLVNYETKTKNAIILKQGDLLTIRGKGKFQIGEVLGQTSKGNIRVLVEKYIS